MPFRPAVQNHSNAASEPTGIIVGGGATSQLIGVATKLYLDKSRKSPLPIFYHHSNMAHTSGFIFDSLIQSFQLPITPNKNPDSISEKGGRLWKYIPTRMRNHLRPMREIYRRIILKIARLAPASTKNIDRELRIEVSGEQVLFGTIQKETGLLTGNYWPGIISEVAHDLSLLVGQSEFPNVFRPIIDFNNDIIVHYRLGDMRTDNHWQQTHGVMDPRNIYEQILQIEKRDKSSGKVIVYSDESAIAKILFESIGALGWEYPDKSDILLDVQKMSNSKHFVGSFSTVSMFVAELRNYFQFNESHLPLNCRRHKIEQKQKGVDYFKARTLPYRHWVYNLPASHISSN